MLDILLARRPEPDAALRAARRDAQRHQDDNRAAAAPAAAGGGPDRRSPARARRAASTRPTPMPCSPRRAARSRPSRGIAPPAPAQRARPGRGRRPRAPAHRLPALQLQGRAGAARRSRCAWRGPNASPPPGAAAAAARGADADPRRAASTCAPRSRTPRASPRGSRARARGRALHRPLGRDQRLRRLREERARRLLRGPAGRRRAPTVKQVFAPLPPIAPTRLGRLPGRTDGAQDGRGRRGERARRPPAVPRRRDRGWAARRPPASKVGGLRSGHATATLARLPTCAASSTSPASSSPATCRPSPAAADADDQRPRGAAREAHLSRRRHRHGRAWPGARICAQAPRARPRRVSGPLPVKLPRYRRAPTVGLMPNASRARPRRTCSSTRTTRSTGSRGATRR